MEFGLLTSIFLKLLTITILCLSPQCIRKHKQHLVSISQDPHSNLSKKYQLFHYDSTFEAVQWKPRWYNMGSALMSLDMEELDRFWGLGLCSLAGRSSSLDTCFRFLENHSLSHPWARFRFKARPVTTVSVYHKTSRSLPLNTGENVLEISYPAVPVQVLSLLVSHFSPVTHYGRKL